MLSVRVMDVEVLENQNFVSWNLVTSFLVETRSSGPWSLPQAMVKRVRCPSLQPALKVVIRNWNCFLGKIMR